MGCEKSIDRRLIGKWDYTEAGIHIIHSAFVSDTSDVNIGATIQFRTSGFGSLALSDSTYDMEWAATDTAVTLTFKGQAPQNYNLTIDNGDLQVWSYQKKEEKTAESGLTYSQLWSSIITLRKI